MRNGLGVAQKLKMISSQPHEAGSRAQRALERPEFTAEGRIQRIISFPQRGFRASDQ